MDRKAIPKDGFVYPAVTYWGDYYPGIIGGSSSTLPAYSCFASSSDETKEEAKEEEKEEEGKAEKGVPIPLPFEEEDLETGVNFIFDERQFKGKMPPGYRSLHSMITKGSTDCSANPWEIQWLYCGLLISSSHTPPEPPPKQRCIVS